MLSRLLPLLMGLGRKRRSKRGGRKMLIQGSGRRRRKTGMRRRMRGRGIFDTIKNIGKKAFNIARSVPIISTGLNLAGKKDWADAAKSVGFGRRRKYRTRYGGRMSIYGGRKRRYRKRRVGGRKRATKRRFSVFGGRKLMGIIPLARGMGGRKRTYRIGLFSRRRR